jgi:ribosomal protein S3AE
VKAEIVTGATVDPVSGEISIVDVLSVACEANGNDSMGRLTEMSMAQLRAEIKAAYERRVQFTVMPVTTLDVLTAFYERRERS